LVEVGQQSGNNPIMNRGGHAVNFDGQGFGLRIRSQVGGGDK